MSSEDNEEDPDARIEEIKDKIEKADLQLNENLSLFAERIMLRRITRAQDKNKEIVNFARILLELGTLTENPHALLGKISGIETMAKEGMTESEEANLFSTMVRATENLNSRQLYYLLQKLRTEPVAEAR